MFVITSSLAVRLPPACSEPHTCGAGQVFAMAGCGRSLIVAASWCISTNHPFNASTCNVSPCEDYGNVGATQVGAEHGWNACTFVLWCVLRRLSVERWSIGWFIMVESLRVGMRTRGKKALHPVPVSGTDAWLYHKGASHHGTPRCIIIPIILSTNLDGACGTEARSHVTMRLAESSWRSRVD